MWSLCGRYSEMVVISGWAVLTISKLVFNLFLSTVFLFPSLHIFILKLMTMIESINKKQLSMHSNIISNLRLKGSALKS